MSLSLAMFREAAVVAVAAVVAAIVVAAVVDAIVVAVAGIAADAAVVVAAVVVAVVVAAAAGGGGVVVTAAVNRRYRHLCKLYQQQMSQVYALPWLMERKLSGLVFPVRSWHGHDNFLFGIGRQTNGLCSKLSFSTRYFCDIAVLR